MAFKNKIKSLDCYLVGDMFIFMSVVAFAKANFKNSVLLAISGLAFHFLGLTIAKTIVHNSTNGVLYGMDENNHDKISIVFPGQSVVNVDGINYNGTVYKIPDGVQATVTSNGIRIISAMGNLVYFVGGGRKSKLPEPSWKKLFQAHLN